MWPRISFLLSAWFLRLLEEGQLSILPLRGQPKKQGLYAKSGSGQSGYARILHRDFASQHFTAMTPSLASRIPIISCFKATKNRGCRASLSCFKGRIECRSRFQVKGSIFVLNRGPFAIRAPIYGLPWSCALIWSYQRRFFRKIKGINSRFGSYLPLH
jgi:hypothetical protein